MLDRCWVCVFLNRFNILSDFCFGWQEIAFPSRSQCHLLLTQPRGPGSGSGSVRRGPPPGRGRGRTPGWARPCRGHKRVSLSPGANGNGPKSFRETPVYSRVRPKLQARLKTYCYSDIPNFCPHIACTVPPHVGYCCSQSFLQFPRALNTARMRKIALFFNDTETFEHCISRIPSRER